METTGYFPCIDTKIWLRVLRVVYCVQAVLCIVYPYSIRGALYSGAAIHKQVDRRDNNLMWSIDPHNGKPRNWKEWHDVFISESRIIEPSNAIYIVPFALSRIADNSSSRPSYMHSCIRADPRDIAKQKPCKPGAVSYNFILWIIM